jgi:hypothetical protein
MKAAVLLSLLLATAHADVIVRWNMYEGYDADAGANYGLTTHPNGGGEVRAACATAQPPSQTEPPRARVRAGGGELRAV